MPYLELTLRCSETTQPRYENALEDVGALAVTMLDAEADTSNERAILEPGVGETPLWNELVLSALFPADADPLVLLAALEAFDEGLDWSGASFRKVEDEDWERAWLDTFKPMSFGHRTWIVPWNHELPEDAQGATPPSCAWTRAWPSARAPTRPPRCACAGSTSWPTRAGWPDRPCSTSVVARASSPWPRSSSAPPPRWAWTTTRRPSSPP
jgi:Ribosomal protein L11 methylase